MVDQHTGKTSLLSRRATRRAVVGGSLAAASVAATYAALGDKLSLFGGGPGAPGALNGSSDTDAIGKESVKISHLLRRAGFGATKEEFDRYQSMGLRATTDELVHYTSVDDDAAVQLANEVPTDQNNRGNLPVWWMVRLTNTKRPLQEKMTLFWHGLLTSQISVVRDPAAMLNQNEFYRGHALDSFPDILRGVSMDPAMMVYLDTSGSQKRAPNENYARELMELFSLGVGNYTEQDIRESARAFTGWMVPRTFIDKNNYTLDAPVFRQDRFDTGLKTFLGRTGNFRLEDIVSIIVEQPASAKFVVGKLFSYFVFPSPEAKDLAPFIDVYTKSNKNVGAVVEALLRSDVFYSPGAYRAIVKSPVEYTVGAIKALGLQATTAQLFAQGRGQAVTSMGQTPFEPPNVAGWPGGATWLNSATMFARLNFINQVTGGAPGGRGAGRNQPPIASNLGTARQATDYYLPFVLDDNLPDEARQVLVDYAGSVEAALAPEQLRGLAYLVLASPQFHLS